MLLITTSVVSFLVYCRLEVRCGYAGVVSRLQPGHYSNDRCGNQQHSRELLMMGIVMPETCSAYKEVQ